MGYRVLRKLENTAARLAKECQESQEMTRKVTVLVTELSHHHSSISSSERKVFPNRIKVPPTQ